MRKKCLNPGHSHKEAVSRGLCPTCYREASRIIKEGRTTWDKLTANGKALAPNKAKTGVVGWLLEETNAR